MILTEEIALRLSNDDKAILDRQSILCSSIYNRVLNICMNDKNYKNKYIYKSHGMRELMTSLKKRYPYYNECSSYSLRGAIDRLLLSYKSYLRKESAYPTFFSQIHGWFSLNYDDPNKGVKLFNRSVRISVGSIIKDGRAINNYLTVGLMRPIRVKSGIKCYRIYKRYGVYYLAIVYDSYNNVNLLKANRGVSIDPNHSNFFMAYTSDGISFMMENFSMIKDLNKECDRIRGKMSRYKREVIIYSTGKKEVYESKNYQKCKRALNKVLNKMNVQIKNGLYAVARMLVLNFDEIAIGDYVPTSNLGKNKAMRRSMINESVIGSFRKILKEVCEKYNRKYILVDESYTTMRCPCCGYSEKKDPSIREYVCKGCNKKINRDIGSAINIGKRAKVLSTSDYVAYDLSKPTYNLYYDYKKNKIIKRD